MSLPLAILDLLFPFPYCPVCAKKSAGGNICMACKQQFKQNIFCDSCATLIDKPGICAACSKRHNYFDDAFAGFAYQDNLRYNLQLFKYNQQTWLKWYLANILLLSYDNFSQNWAPNRVMAIPLSTKKLAERGYNQAELLAEIVAKQLQVIFDKTSLIRIKETPPLANFNGLERQAIMKNAFSAQELNGQSILLIDDIYTSGATLNSAAKALKMAGAAKVYALCVATYLQEQD